MRARLLAVIVPLLSACSGDAPPLAELPLRDALSATPEAIAELPDPTRRALAERFETTRKLPQSSIAIRATSTRSTTGSACR